MCKIKYLENIYIYKCKKYYIDMSFNEIKQVYYTSYPV